MEKVTDLKSTQTSNYVVLFDQHNSMVNKITYKSEAYKVPSNVPTTSGVISNTTTDISRDIVPLIDINSKYPTPQILRSYYTPNTTFTSALGDNNPTVCIVTSYSPIVDSMINDINSLSIEYNLPKLSLPGQNIDTALGQYISYYQSTAGSQIFTTNKPLTSPNTYPASNPWALSASIAANLVHQISPYSNIIVVYAANGGLDDCIKAYQFAQSIKQYNIVSMCSSWGNTESESLLAQYDAILSKNPNIVYCAPSGSSASTKIILPAAHPNVVACGGTYYSVAENKEYGWNGSGGGVSSFIPKPSYQTSLNNTFMSVPDVGLLASYDSGPYIYQYGKKIQGVGGTSVSTAIMAGMVAALCHQFAVKENIIDKVNIASIDILNCLYSGNTVRDIVSDYPTDVWTNTNHTTNGYDLVTGMGSPLFMNLLSKVKFIVQHVCPNCSTINIV
jgi:hypothetical protein